MCVCVHVGVCLLAFVCVYSLCMSVCVWMRLKGGRDMKMDGVCVCVCVCMYVHLLFFLCVCVDLFDDADPISQLLH